MMQKLLQWQLWFHYLLLTLSIFLIIHPSSGFLEERINFTCAIQSGGGYPLLNNVWDCMVSWQLLFIWYLVGIILSDLLIHFLLEKFTGWKD